MLAPALAEARDDADEAVEVITLAGDVVAAAEVDPLQLRPQNPKTPFVILEIFIILK